MKIYVAKIVRRTEVTKEFERHLPSGTAYNSKTTFAFDEVIRESYHKGLVGANEGLKQLMWDVCEYESYGDEPIKFEKPAGEPFALLWPKGIKLMSQRFTNGQGNQYIFMAILSEEELA